MDSIQYKNHRGPAPISELTIDIEPKVSPQTAPGESAANVASSSATSTDLVSGSSVSASGPPLLCAHVTSAGRRCRLPVAENHNYLCARHRPARKAPPLDEALAKELFDSVENLASGYSVTIFLENVAWQFARRRLKRSDAVTLAYIGQLALNSQGAMERQTAIAKQDAIPVVRFDLDPEKKEEHAEEQEAEHLPPWRR